MILPALCMHLQAVCIPFVGIVGNVYNRIYLIVAGTLVWGAMSTGMGFATNYREVLHPFKACCPAC